VPIKIVFLDCDGTLTPIKSSWEYLHRRLGLWDNNADAYQRLFRSGAIDYYEFCKRDALLWRGLSLEQVLAIIKEIPFQNGAEVLVGALRRMGVVTAIISTGLSFLVYRIKEVLGVHVAIANELRVENGCLTGSIEIHVEYNKKGEVVNNILSLYGFTKEEACAIGDGEGDEEMFKACGLSIGFRPHPHVLPMLDYTIYGDSLEPAIDIIQRYV